VHVTIVKESGRSHRAVAVRDDGEAVQFAVADYGDRLPHDLVHYLVESTLDLDWGLWGLVAAGADLDAVARHGARHRRNLPHRPDPLSRLHLSEERQRLEAELSHTGDPVDLAALEKSFIKVARAYGERKPIIYRTWRTAHLSASVLQNASVSLTRD